MIPEREKTAFLSGKENENAVNSVNSSFVLKCLNNNRKIDFLIDTGAEVSILPKSFRHVCFPLNVNLNAANGTHIESFGYIISSVSIPSLRRSFKTKFIVADVNQPILGLDFFMIII